MSDVVTAYDQPEPKYLRELTEVERGTPMGELLRRYWHPVGLSEDASSTPRIIKVLGEELILFRDGQGRPGLVHPRCAHRGSSLYYGKTEERGIRCCYHGWLFDVEGNCLEQPCEPDSGEAQRHRVRQPWYPLEERYGLIFAYMGPPNKKPLLPRYSLLENLDSDEMLEADDSSIGSGGAVIVPCNWFQHYENVMDPYHVPVLHGTFSGTQFVPEMAVMPDVEFQTYELGVRSIQNRDLDDGRKLRRVSEALLPTVRVVPSPRLDPGTCSLIGWVVPIDSTSFRIYSTGRVREPGQLRGITSRFNGKPWAELTEEEHQQFPGDYEAQVSQGEITLHSEEHLATSDRGIAMLRRLVQRQVRAVADGQDPIGTAFEPGKETIESEAGNFISG